MQIPRLHWIIRDANDPAWSNDMLARVTGTPALVPAFRT